MLRLLVVLLILANAAFFGWRQGWLDGVVGVRPDADREPARLAKQVEPQRVRVLGPEARVAATAPAPEAPSVCLEVGPFTSAQLDGATGALQGVLPPDRIEDVRRETPPVWIVFMGPYNDAETRRKKGDELARMKVAFQEIRQVPELGDGLALGRFETRAAAEKALADVTTKGVRSARLAQFQAAIVSHTLRVRGIGTDQQAQLQALQAPGLQGKTVGLCGG